MATTDSQRGKAGSAKELTALNRRLDALAYEMSGDAGRQTQRPARPLERGGLFWVPLRRIEGRLTALSETGKAIDEEDPLFRMAERVASLGALARREGLGSVTEKGGRVNGMLGDFEAEVAAIERRRRRSGKGED
jgi:hypothetical protein